MDGNLLAQQIVAERGYNYGIKNGVLTWFQRFDADYRNMQQLALSFQLILLQDKRAQAIAWYEQGLEELRRAGLAPQHASLMQKVWAEHKALLLRL